MVDTLCIFEDIHCTRLHPLVYLRPTYDLRCGITTLRQKIQRAYPELSVTLHCRGYLRELVQEQNHGVVVNDATGKGCLFVNGRVVAGGTFRSEIPLEGEEALYVDGDTIVAARVRGGRIGSLKQSMAKPLDFPDFEGLTRHEVRVKTIRYPWDLLAHNGEQIVADFRTLAGDPKQRIRGTVYEGTHLIDRANIVIGEGSRIKPGAVLDAENGPIFIGNNARVFPNATIEGPAFVGDNSLIKIGAKIYENTSIGEFCKVGGEVEGSIIHSYSNKQHDGFLGHAYLAMWVNLGADTNNSDLKNNYGSVRVYINGEPVDSGSMFVGLMMGDHSKSSINTMFNTGTVVGVSSNVFGAGFPPKYVPSFAWGGADGLTTYELGRSLDVAKRVMARRKRTLSPAEEGVLRTVFDITGDERRKSGMPQ